MSVVMLKIRLAKTMSAGFLTKYPRQTMMVAVGIVLLAGGIIGLIKQVQQYPQGSALIAEMEEAQVASVFGNLEDLDHPVVMTDGQGFAFRVTLGNFPRVSWNGLVVVSYLHQKNAGLYLGKDSQGRSYYAYPGWGHPPE